VPAADLRKALSAADIPSLVDDLSGKYFPIRKCSFSETAWCRKEFGMSCFGNAQYFRKNNTYGFYPADCRAVSCMIGTQGIIYAQFFHEITC
jgi:hypothetical protein